MAKMGKLRVLKISVEANKGVAVAGATVMLVFDPVLAPADNMIQREPATAFGGQATAETGPSVGTCTFTAELRSNGVATYDAGLLIALQACGWAHAAGVLSPATAITSQKTCTLDLSRDGLLERLYGAMGTCRIVGDVGQRVMLEFEFSGVYAKQADTAMPAQTLPTTPAVKAAGGSLTLDAHGPKIGRFAVSLGGTPEPVEDINAAGGVAYYVIGAGRRPIIEIDPEVEASATWDYRGLWAAKTPVAVSLGLTDGDVDITIEAPTAQVLTPGDSVRGSRYTYNVQIQCNANAGDDELTITAAAVV